MRDIDIRLRRWGVAAAVIGAIGLAHGKPRRPPILAEATADISGRGGAGLQGSARFEETLGSVSVQLVVVDARPGLHAVQILSGGDCMAVNRHFNPGNRVHGRPGTGHAGDLGNVAVTRSGWGTLLRTIPGVTLEQARRYGLLWRAVVIRAGPDDFRSNDGGAGAVIGCGLIQPLGERPPSVGGR